MTETTDSHHTSAKRCTQLYTHTHTYVRGKQGKRKPTGEVQGGLMADRTGFYRRDCGFEHPMLPRILSSRILEDLRSSLENLPLVRSAVVGLLRNFLHQL